MNQPEQLPNIPNMNITLVPTPKKVTKAAVNAAQGGSLFLEPDYVPTNMELACPHPTFFTGLEWIKESQSLTAKAVQTGWRFFAVDGEEVLCDVYITMKNEFASSTQNGPIIEAFVDSLHRLEAAVTEGVYTLNLLRIPGLYLELVWLRGENGQDWLVSIGSFYDDTITRFEMYTPEDMYTRVAAILENHVY